MSEVQLRASMSWNKNSSAVVEPISTICPGNVKTFMVGVGDGQPGADERPYARTMAERFKVDHLECLCDDSQKQVGSILPLVIQSFDEPFADSSKIPKYLKCQAARQWVTEAISGIGA